MNKDLIFLNNYTAGSRRISYNVTENASNGDYKIDAGEAHGVTVEAEFAVYSSTVPSEELGLLVVHKTDAFQSYLRPLIMTDDMSFRIPETGAFALQTRIGILHDVRLLIELDAGLAGVLTAVGQQMLTTSAFKPSIKVVTTREENPDLIVTARGGTAHFEITDQICCDAGLHEIYHRPETDKNTMTRVLRGVADFYWHLHRKPQLKEKTISTKINLKCYELVTVEIDNNLLPVMKPTGKDLLVNGAIQIGISDDQKPYGFRINNACNIPLFVSVFYFNMSDLSIGEFLCSEHRRRLAYPSYQIRTTSLHLLVTEATLNLSHLTVSSPLAMARAAPRLTHFISTRARKSMLDTSSCSSPRNMLITAVSLRGHLSFAKVVVANRSLSLGANFGIRCSYPLFSV